MTPDETDQRNWAEYYEKTGFRPPRKTLLRALDAFDREEEPTRARFAVDLGCGNGRDTVEMLHRGWRVLAIDREEAAISGLRDRVATLGELPLETRADNFQTATWPEADLVNSSFALPLCPPADFRNVWARIVASLRPGGRFSGQLFGDRDSWSGRDGMTFLNREELDQLLAGLEIEFLEEEEDDGVTPRGTPKHWHIWHIVARKPV